MAFHVRDPKTDALVRKLAQKKGVGITEAVREAVEDALDREEQKASLWERTADLRAEVASWPKTGLKADKEFYDSLYEESSE